MGGGAPSQDTTPPIITQGGITTEEGGDVTVGWMTDEPSTSTVLFGETEALGSSVGSDALVLQHEVQLDGLVGGTTYYMRVQSEDEAGNSADSPTVAFVAGDAGGELDLDPPQISGLSATATGATEITVVWTTDEPASGQVDYGLTQSYGETVSSASPATAHTFVLDDLAEGGVYHLRVSGSDPSGNASASGDLVVVLGGSTGPAEVTGTLTAWYPITLTFDGPTSSEGANGPNPFLDYRLQVRLIGPSGQRLDVPGFFDGDGNGGAVGNAWRARVVADEGGTWTYTASFRQGDDVAVSTLGSAGTPTAFDGAGGAFTVAPPDPAAPGFYKWGKLEYVGEHYLKFRDGPYFLKGGTDSPENFLGYAGFDNTEDQPGGVTTTGLTNGLHRYATHVADWNPGDPLFQSEDTGVDSKGIVGALNYLSSKQVNSVYFLPMNLGGDGRETYPFVGPIENTFDKTHYDISKLGQWNQVFEHAVRKGIQLHFVLNETETENEEYLDNGNLGVERKLFYREMIARFGHALAIKWNLSEECDFTKAELQSFADYIDAVDPWGHPIGFHTHYLGDTGSYGDYSEVLGDPRFTLTSIQGAPESVGTYVEKWRADSAASGHKWVVSVDEIGPAGTGLTTGNAGSRRRSSLWDVYLSGGDIEWYAGYHGLPMGGDVRLEDFRTREAMWEYMGYARELLQALPFWEMEPADDLVSGETSAYGGAEVFAKTNDVYIVYYPETDQTGAIDLSGASGSFSKRWFNPRHGSWSSSVKTIAAGGQHTIGYPNSGPTDQDWVLLLQK